MHRLIMGQEGGEGLPQVNTASKKEKSFEIRLPNGHLVTSRGNRGRFLLGLSDGALKTEDELRAMVLGPHGDPKTPIGENVLTINDTTLADTGCYIERKQIKLPDGSKKTVFQMLESTDEPKQTTTSPFRDDPMYSHYFGIAQAHMVKAIQASREPIQEPDVLSKDKISKKYLDALEKYIDYEEFDSPTKEDETVVPPAVRAGLVLQTTLNYLAVRVHEDTASFEEEVVWGKAIDLTETTDDRKALEKIKGDVRRSFGIDHHYFSQGEDAPEASLLTSQEIVQLAKVITMADIEVPAQVKARTELILESLLNPLHTNSPVESRIHGLSLLIDKTGAGEEEILPFIESHSPTAQEILYFLEDKREFLFQTFLDQIKDHHAFMRPGELQEKARKLFQGSGIDPEPYVKQAEAVESSTAVFELYDAYKVSEKEAQESFETPGTTPLEIKTSVPAVQKTRPAATPRNKETFEEAVEKRIRKVVKRYIEKWEKQPISQFNPIQLATFFRLHPNEVQYVTDHRMVNPAKKSSSSGDYHPWFTIDEALMAAAAVKVQGVKQELLVDVGFKVINEELQKWKDKHPDYSGK